MIHFLLTVFLLTSGFAKLNYNFEQLLGYNIAEEKELEESDFIDMAFFEENFHNNYPLLLETVTEGLRIPAVIHVIWLGAKPFPLNSVKNLTSWRKFHPKWKMKFWTDSPTRAMPIDFMEKHLISELGSFRLAPFLSKTINYGEQSDIIRYEILFREGGLYIDHDVECRRSFEKIHTAFDFYAGLEPINESATRDSKFTVGNGIIGTKPGHPLFQAVMDRIENKWDYFQNKFPGNDSFSQFIRVLHRTFDSFNLSVLEHLNHKPLRTIIFPTACFFARSTYPAEKLEQLDQLGLLYANHFWDHSWFDESDKIGSIKLDLKQINFPKITKKMNLLFLAQIVFLILNVSLFVFFLIKGFKKRLCVLFFLSHAAIVSGLESNPTSLYEQVLAYEPQLLDHYYYRAFTGKDFLDFLQIFQNRPIEHNFFGMTSVGNFYLWYLLKQISPALVIESGVWRGQSTWMIEQAAPHASVIAIDPDLSNRVYVSSKASYTTRDFSRVRLRQKIEGPIVAFFDDHQNAYTRVLQAYSKGIKFLIFDDNYPPGYDDAGNRHLTLRDIFEMPIHSDKANRLKPLIKNYFIMPQIVGTTATFTDKRTLTRLPALWKTLDDVDISLRKEMEIFYNDSPSYRWTTFVELNEKAQ